MLRYHPRHLLQLDIKPRGLCVGCFVCGWCRCGTEAVSAVVGEGEPSQRRDFQPLCRAAMPPVPDAVEARGLLPTFGDNTGIDDQGLCMCRGDHVEDRRLVEGDKVNFSGVPTGKGSFLRIPLCSMSPEFLNLLKRGHENASPGTHAHPLLASICA